MPYNTTYNMDCVLGMQFLDDETIDMVLTSPPYDNLRTYGGESPWNFDVFKEVALGITRVLKEGGVVAWNVNDSTIDGSETGMSFKQALFFKDECGLRLHDTMIYEKVGIAFAAGAKSNRYSQAFEYVFILSKGKPKTTNLIMDKPNKWAGYKTFGDTSARDTEGNLKSTGKRHTVHPVGVRNNIWRVNNNFGFSQKNKDVHYKHPASMPPDLASGHIQSWSNEGDLVLDPFMGSGTTARESKALNRRWVGFEIHKDYCDMANLTSAA